MRALWSAGSSNQRTSVPSPRGPGAGGAPRANRAP